METRPEKALRKRNAAELTQRGRGRPKTTPEETQRAAIVAMARRLFLGKGYGSTTTDDIAAQCRISKQTLYRLFPGKAALFTAVIEAHRQHWLDLPGDYADLPLEEALARIFRADISPEMDEERMGLIRLVVAETGHFPELGEILRQYGAEAARDVLANWLEAQSARGRVVLDDAASASRMLMDMVLGAIIVKSTGDLTWPGGQDRATHIRRCIAVFLNGVRPRDECQGNRGGKVI